jgi:hypothetical protein
MGAINQIDSDTLWSFMTTTSAGDEEKLKGSHRIIAIFWNECTMATGDIAANDEILITDGEDRIIFNKVAAGTPATAPNDTSIVIGYPGLLVKGFKLPVLGGGMLVVWLAAPHT